MSPTQSNAHLKIDKCLVRFQKSGVNGNEVLNALAPFSQKECASQRRHS